MLIRRRVDVMRLLATELSLDLSVTLVQSSENHADVITHVPGEWVTVASVTVAERAIPRSSIAMSTCELATLASGASCISRSVKSLE